jgi:hypothetical protein
VLRQALNLGSNIPQTPLDQRNFEIISLHPVLASESQFLCLAAITSTGKPFLIIGHKLFFSHHSNQRYTHTDRPTALTLVYVRPPPVIPSVSGHVFHNALYANGVTIAAQSKSDEIDRICGIVTEPGAIAKVNINNFSHFLNALLNH